MNVAVAICSAAHLCLLKEHVIDVHPDRDGFQNASKIKITVGYSWVWSDQRSTVGFCH